MRHRELTDAQRIYIQFVQRRRIAITTLIVFLVGILLCFATAFGFVDENPAPLLLFTGILLVYTAIAIFVCRYFARKHEELYVAAYGNDYNIIRSGLFEEIWEEFEWNQFEGLTDGKVVFAETHNNTIDIDIIRHKHEFNIIIGKDAVYMVMDDETDTPVEKELSLSSMTDVAQVFTAIREFVESV